MRRHARQLLDLGRNGQLSRVVEQDGDAALTEGLGDGGEAGEGVFREGKAVQDLELLVRGDVEE